MTKDITIRIVAVLAVALLASQAHAGVIFQQDFTSSTTVSDYVEGGGASGGQFTSIEIGTPYASKPLSTVTDSIASNALTFAVAEDDATHGASLAFANTSALTGTPELASMQVAMSILNPLGNSNANSRAAVGFVATSASTGGLRDLINIMVNGSTITFSSSKGVALTQTVSAGDEFTMTVYGNNSGASANFTGVDGNSYTIGNDKSFVFINNIIAFDVATYTEGLDINRTGDPISYARVTANNGIDARNLDGGTIAFDSLVVRDDLAMPVPEPATLMLMAAGLPVLLKHRRRRS